MRPDFFQKMLIRASLPKPHPLPQGLVGEFIITHLPALVLSRGAREIHCEGWKVQQSRGANCWGDLLPLCSTFSPICADNLQGLRGLQEEKRDDMLSGGREHRVGEGVTFAARLPGGDSPRSSPVLPCGRSWLRSLSRYLAYWAMNLRLDWAS